MFISDTHLPQVLPSAAYHSVAQHELEFAKLFATGWHMVGSTADIPTTGDYFTIQLGNIPLLVRNFGDDFQTFLNVCAHRFCEISSKKRAHAPTLSCQYHGWEYDRHGDTQCIPDAPSFKPLQKGMLGLKRYRTAICGQLIFVSLASEGSELQEFLGKNYETYERLFSSLYEQVLSSDVECEANWKLAVDITLESYHLECVHPKTFGSLPPAEECSHELHDDYTVFHTKPKTPPQTLAFPGVLPFLESVVARASGQSPSHDYMNLRTYPSMSCGRSDVATFVQSTLPLSPTHSLQVNRVFMPRPIVGSWMAKLLYRGLRPLVAKFWKSVFAEDQVILPKIQKGISAPVMPNGGLISNREERIFHFQEYVARRCGMLPASVGKPQ